jgi:HEAT repeat protein
MAAAPYLETARQAPATADRVMAAQVIGAVQRPDFYAPLLDLLADEAVPVRQAALEAAAQVRHPRLLSAVIGNLRPAATRTAALNTLLVYGPAGLPAIAVALDNHTDYSSSEVQRLVRLGGQIGGPAAIDLLRQHWQHPDSAIQEEILITLNRCGFQATASDRPAIQQILRQQVDYAAVLLAAQRDIGQDEAATMLQKALQGELDRVKQRLIYLLALLYDGRAIRRAGEQLAQQQTGAQALALELLDITLADAEKALVLPLIEPDLSPDERLGRLPDDLQPPHKSREAWLVEMISNRTGMWTERWLPACAIYTAGRLGRATGETLRQPIAEATGNPDPLVRETALWAGQALHPPSV